ncbi:MAG: NAD(P)/FAD-dependent oxidoreductase [Myxococcales bacterium]|nr:NAD(P)/FAD-dependent oxidoreductase [Myxococcales bacterium]
MTAPKRRPMTGEQAQWDVIICGGGMAGLTLARQLRLEWPSLRVAVAERTRRPIPASCHKVGESNAELGSQYLERLGLREYLRREHVVKLGLRFFPGGGTLPLERRTEIGPMLEPVVKGYQIDRGRFEQDLRGMVEEQGVTLWEGTMVRDLQLGGEGPHAVVLEREGERMRQTTRWVVDATGRSGLLRRRFGSKRAVMHAGNAGWFRVEGRLRLDELTAEPTAQWREAPLASERWRSTTHLMGVGYWVWIIALPGERTSIGVVTQDELHGFDRVRTHARVMAFLREHEPALAERLALAELLDFRCIRHYSYGIERSWSAERWAVVGEAGVFADPLYSPGTDFIALSNCSTVELLRAEAAGEDLEARAESLDRQFREHVEGSLSVYRRAAPIYGHARAMASKVYWDNFAYWSYTCQYFLQGIYRAQGELEAAVTRVRARFIELSGHVQALLSAWATAHPEPPRGGFSSTPPFPSLSVDAHLDLQKSLDPAQTLALMQTRLGQGEQMVAELVVRLMLELGPHDGARVLEAAGVPLADLPLDPARAQAEPTVGLARRRALSRVSRDVERALGRVPRHPQWAEALERLFGANPAHA